MLTSKKQSKKKSFTLIEIIIGISLFATVITLLFSIFEKSCRINTRLQEAKRLNEQHLIVQVRLQTLLAKARSSKKAKTYPFFTINGKNNATELVFTFDNGPDVDRDFAGDVIARLYVNAQNELTLSYWPLLEENQEHPLAIRSECLLENVATIKWSFFRIDSSDEKEKTRCISQWENEWDQDWKSLPLIIKIIVTKNNKTTTNTESEFWILMNDKLGKIPYKGGV